MKISMWYETGLNKYLSELGFKHFSTGEYVFDDFKDGKAFFVDTDKEVFGLADMVANESIDQASSLSHEFSDTGKLLILEVAKMKVTNTRQSNDMLDYKLELIADWHHARGLVDGATDATQFVKLMEEVGELAGNLARSKDIRDDIGDIIVVLVNILERNGLTLKECVDVAYEDIKDRKGKCINGCYVKEADL
ncbi:hypothetical protein NVP1134O_37 [Vibrio phage 1.134.O._10N.222.52.B8]|nr:hypothetical protein NVP1134O_37 [Vibrio phage 1.134.O._10N.222.52.B8]